MLMNNRFVVPGMVDNVTKFSTLQGALTTPGLNAGDVIQIEPGSSPGQIVSTDVPAIQNLTIQGDPASDVQSIPYFVVIGNSGAIDSARQGFTLKSVEVDIQNGTLLFTADFTITGCRIKDDVVGGQAITLQGTSAAVISDCYIENSSPLNQNASLVSVMPANGSHNRITDNQFVAVTGTNIPLLVYSGGAGITDVVAHNTFIGNTGSVPLFFVWNNTQGLTLQANTFTDSYDGGVAIEVHPTVQNLQIVDNVISLANSRGGSTGIFVDAGKPTASSSMVIANNHIHSGGGIGIEFAGETPGSTFVAKVEGNDLRGNDTGVFIWAGLGGSVAGIDLGGGAQGSLGANNFRGDFRAIDVSASLAAGPIQAKMNIFGVADPTTVIYDHNNDPTLASVVATGPLTGNAAYVETLYLDFLHRTGDVSNPNDAGGWVNLMGQGTSATAVASGIARSPEALDAAVTGLFHRFLGRNPKPAGLATFVSYLQTGGTLEGVSQQLLASPEYQSHFPTDSSFVQSLYQNLLHRTGSSAEISQWVALLPTLGRAGVAQGLLTSQEFRDWEVLDDYTQLLDNPQPTAAQLSGWVGGGKDLLTIDTLFAASPEFQLNG
jgi:hypothetical protein